MTKSNVCWLIVRLIGLYLIYEAIQGMFTFLQTVLTGLTSTPGRAMLAEGTGLLTGMGIEALIFLFAALYFLFNGTLVYKLLMGEPIREE